MKRKNVREIPSSEPVTKRECKNSFISRLPVDLLLHVASFLPRVQMWAMHLTCKAWLPSNIKSQGLAWEHYSDDNQTALRRSIERFLNLKPILASTILTYIKEVNMPSKEHDRDCPWKAAVVTGSVVLESLVSPGAFKPGDIDIFFWSGPIVTREISDDGTESVLNDYSLEELIQDFVTGMERAGSGTFKHVECGIESQFNVHAKQMDVISLKFSMSNVPNCFINFVRVGTEEDPRSFIKRRFDLSIVQNFSDGLCVSRSFYVLKNRRRLLLFIPPTHRNECNAIQRRTNQSSMVG